MIPPEQIHLHPLPALGRPLQGHHVGEIIGSDTDTLILPINEVDIALLRGMRKQNVQTVEVAMNQGDVAGIGEATAALLPQRRP